jgi:ATP-dependent helicase/DNAse subunit B
MEDITISEIVRGITDESMKSERFALLQLLSNKVGEQAEPLTSEEASSVFTIALAKLSPTTDDTLVEVMIGLLANATISEQNAQKFMQFLGTEKYNAQLSVAVNTFLDHNTQLEADTTDDAWSHMSSVLCNLCQIEEGRTLILRQSLNYIPRIIKQVHPRLNCGNDCSCFLSWYFTV